MRHSCGDVVLLLKPEAAGGAIDPVRRAFQFQEGADRSFIEHRDAGAPRLVEFRAVLFVPEHAMEVQTLQNRHHRRSVVDLELQFFPALVPAGLWLTFIRQGRHPAGLANPQQP
jgi:hypothetical protein